MGWSEGGGWDGVREGMGWSERGRMRWSEGGGMSDTKEPQTTRAAKGELNVGKHHTC